MSHSFPNTGKTVWSRPRSQGKSYLQKIIQDMAELEAKRIERDIVMGETEGGLFVPQEYSEELSEVMKHQHFTDWSYRKYNINKKVLIL